LARRMAVEPAAGQPHPIAEVSRDANHNSLVLFNRRADAEGKGAWGVSLVWIRAR
jgi:hypothetical protein